MFAPISRVSRSLLHGEVVIWPAVVAGVAAAVGSLAAGSLHLDLDVEVALASMTTFLFGVLLAFTIARTRERLVLIRGLMSEGNAALQSIHQMMAVFPEPDRSTIRDLVDRQLTSQIDYRLVDNHLANPAHDALVEAIYALDPTTRQEEVLYRKLTELCIHMGAYRAKIDTATGEVLLPVEWTGMFLLLGVIVAMLVVMPGGTLWGALVAGLLTGTLVTLLIVLRQLDRLVWHEEASIWGPTTRLFRSIGRDPYVPRMVIDSGRYVPTGRVRVVDYPDRYPDRSHKVVTLEEFDDGVPLGRPVVPDETTRAA